MKRTALIAILTAAGTAGAADYTDTARVIDAQPIIQQESRQECHTETVQVQGQAQQQGRNYTGAVIGGVAGGVIGNQIGQGNGRTVATAVGAAVGAITGDTLQNQNNGAQAQPQTQQQQVCSNNLVPVTTGYRVRYSYLGREGNTITRAQPGSTIQVGITAFQ